MLAKKNNRFLFFCALLGSFLMISACTKTEKQPIYLKTEGSQKGTSSSGPVLHAQQDGHDWTIDNGGNNISLKIEKQISQLREDLAEDLSLLIDKEVAFAALEKDFPKALSQLRETLRDPSYVYSPTNQDLFVEYMGQVIPVDARNNPENKTADFKIASWAAGNWCDRTVLVIHETFGLLKIEKSLDFSKTGLIADFLTGCVGDRDAKEYSRLSVSYEEISQNLSEGHESQDVYYPLYRELFLLSGGQFEKWFCQNDVGQQLFGEHIDIQCLGALTPHSYFAIEQMSTHTRLMSFLEYSINGTDPELEKDEVEKSRNFYNRNSYQRTTRSENFFLTEHNPANVFLISLHFGNHIDGALRVYPLEENLGSFMIPDEYANAPAEDPKKDGVYLMESLAQDSSEAYNKHILLVGPSPQKQGNK